MKKTVLFWLIFLLVIFSAACAPITRPEQDTVVDSLPLEAGQTLGQSFVARFDGLNSVGIYLAPLEPGNGEIQLTLRNKAQGQKLGRATISIATITAPGFYRFSLPTQANSNQKDYYLTLKIKGAGSVNVGTAPGNTYLNGALYHNGAPDDAHQMAFQLSYHPPRLAMGLLKEGLTWGWYLLVAAFLFVLPGWAILAGTGGRGDGVRGGESVEGETRGSDGDTPGNYTPDTHLVYLAMRNRWVKLGLAAGISVAIYPILFLWTDLIGLHLGALYAWIPPLAGAVLLLWKYVKAWHQGALKKLRLPGIQLADAALLFVLGLVILTRFWVIRSLPLPMWGDSYQHTMMAQLLVDNGGLFNSWKPYAELTTFTYHFGFHSLVAIFHWITQLSLPQSTLWVGQILNILAVIVIYPLAMLIFNN
ncbi:MAG TPA: hypothetical protein EYP88_00630, partial [Anaerolineales bacterium]|nr:hypothetical protein [Anaerolineales bacterium]